MTIVAWVVIGIIAGLAARAIVPGEIQGGLLTDLGIGIAGAIIGGWLGGVFLGTRPFPGLNLQSIVVATCGAVALLFLIHAVARRQSTTV